MEDIVLAGAAADVAPLRSALTAAGIQTPAIERAQELEPAIRASRAPVVVIADGTCDATALRRLQRAYPDRQFIAWLPRTATARAAQLLEQGYADALSPAMGQAELLTRIRSAGERRSVGTVHAVTLGALVVDAPNGRAAWGNTDLRLTRRERELLHALADAAPEPVRRDQLYRAVWGYAMARGDRTVDVNVTRLRAKVAVVTKDLVIATAPGVGYRLELRTALPSVTRP